MGRGDILGCQAHQARAARAGTTMPSPWDRAASAEHLTDSNPQCSGDEERAPAAGKAAPALPTAFSSSHNILGVAGSFSPVGSPPLTCGPLAGNLGRIFFVQRPPAALFFPHSPHPLSLFFKSFMAKQ